MSCAFAPWSIARGSAVSRQVLLLLVLGALLYGFVVHAARACVQAAAPAQAEALASGSPSDHCHESEAAALTACESHCRADAQSSRASLSFDLPAAAPLDAAVPLAPIITLAASDGAAPPPRDSGPPLHVLFHRFLR
jgi:hypothetical protein